MAVSPSQASPDAAVAWLRSPAAIRSRCAELREKADARTLDHFAVDLAPMDAAARYVIDVIRSNYPDLEIPYHSRWRHFAAGGHDRWADLKSMLAGVSEEEIARVRFDLTVTSVLLDAGAGGAWTYRARDGVRFARSEGLAVASFEAFVHGRFSCDQSTPLRADAEALASIGMKELAEVFQVSGENPLVGLNGRVALLRQLGLTMQAQPAFFGSYQPRIGGLFDVLIDRAANGRLPATEILSVVLEAFGSIWPGRIALNGVNLGDVWRHSAIRADDPTDGLIPFHKLSQWLSYSLVEPIEDAGISVVGLDALTGLPEYRNGGLLIDLGILKPKHDRVTSEVHDVGSEVIVEWRALTVNLLDTLAERIRTELDLDPMSLSLARILEGGTWAAGRKIAAERRSDGGPPIRVDSDGTVF